MTMPLTPEKPADMSEAELRRWNRRHDIVSMNETDRAAGKRLIECLRKRSASDAWHAEGVNRLRFDGEILQRLISKYPPRAKHRKRRDLVRLVLIGKLRKPNGGAAVADTCLAGRKLSECVIGVLIVGKSDKEAHLVRLRSAPDRRLAQRFGVQLASHAVQVLIVVGCGAIGSKRQHGKSVSMELARSRERRVGNDARRIFELG